MSDSHESDFLTEAPKEDRWASLGEPDVSAPSDDALPVTRRSQRKVLDKGEVSTARWIGETLGLLVLALVLAQGIKTFLIQPYIVPTGSMIPTIQINDRILANKLVYWIGGAPEVGDIVVLDDPTGQFDMLVKRVVAVGGQSVDLKDGALYVDGEMVVEPFVHGLPSEPQIQTFPFEVPEGEVWVMGDNRTNSADSRSFGSVPISTVRGRAFWTYWPIDRFGQLK